MIDDVKDWSPAKIKYELSKLDYSLAKVDRECVLKEHSAANTTRIPHTKGEDAISGILMVSAHKIWPSRYDKDGNRLSPQPSGNYIPESVNSNKN